MALPTTINTSIPDLTASHFSHWVDLIAASQGFDHNNNNWHEFVLPYSLVQELLDANAVWALAGHAIRNDTMEDLLARFPKRTTRGLETEAVFDGQREWFLRLDSCSTKDARGAGGKKYGSAIRTVEDALQRIAASKRATRALEDILLWEKARPGPARLFFIPHNKHMDTSREFRVFCPPVWSLSKKKKMQHRSNAMPSVQTIANQRAGLDVLREEATPWNHLVKNETCEDPPPNQHPSHDENSLGRITAISQYRWHTPYHHHHDHPPRSPTPSGHARAQVDATKALTAAQAIHAQITTHAIATPSVAQTLRAEGFVFDMFEAACGEMQLLELNPFGAMSGCGSCLFQWVVDAGVLYGVDDEVEVEVRVTL